MGKATRMMIVFGLALLAAFLALSVLGYYEEAGTSSFELISVFFRYLINNPRYIGLIIIFVGFIVVADRIVDR